MTTPEIGVSIDELPSAIVATDLEHVITAFSSGAEELFLWRREQVLGRRSLDLGIRPGDEHQAAEVFRTVLAGRDFDGVVPLQRSDGSSVLTHLVARLRRDPAGTPVGMVILASKAFSGTGPEARALARLSLLSRAGARLAESLTVEDTVTTIASLTVPSLADHALIDLYSDEGTLVRGASAHDHTVAEAAQAWAAVGTTVDYPAVHPVAQCLASGLPMLVQLPPDALIDEAAPTARSAAYAKKVGLSSLIAAPLTARGAVLGVLSLCRSITDEPYNEEDLDLASELARRAALALDNARLFEREREIAVTLQRSLLPQSVPVVDGLTFDTQYVPSGSTSAGGDWFDVIELSSGRTGIVIGDVQGRGATAAAVMGQLRAALGAYAVLELAPAEVLGHLDALVQRLDAVQLVTCLYVIYDPFTRECRMASAGHLPPLVLRSGESLVVELVQGTPLGAGGLGGDDHSESVLCLEPGDGLALFTDGLVERRGSDLDIGMAALADVLRSYSCPGEGVRAALGLLDPNHDDDAALLLATTSLTDLPWVSIELSGPHPARDAREFATATLADWGLRTHEDGVCLLVSELVTNAQRHGSPGRSLTGRRRAGDPGELPEPTAVSSRAPVLTLRRGSSALWIEVADADLRLPRLRHAGDDDEGGRGLLLVDVLAARWGARPAPDGKAVWCQLAL